MTTFITFSVLAIVVGCIYALTATGLVVTYTTSGIFNFAHGAIGMIGAFTYWQLTVVWGWPALLALVAVLFVGAPLFGAVIERTLMRPLQGASVDLTLVVTLGLLLFLLGAANFIWPYSTPRRLPEFFHSLQPIRIGSLNLSYSQLLIVVVAIGVAFSLRVLFTKTRIGIAMRGVVDDPDLTAMTGASPARIQQLSWAISASLAALAGILLAPSAGLNSITLTLLVINGYAAALFGKLKSLPRTAAGAIILGFIVEFYPVYIEPNVPFASSTFMQLEKAVPMIFLFILLIFIPAGRLRTSTTAGRIAPTVPGLRQSIAGAGGLIVTALLLTVTLSSAHLVIGTRVAITGITLLSLVLLTGYSGQTSLCHLTFVGLGAYAMGTFSNGSILGVIYAVLLAAGAGAIVAVFTARLRGLYLALATFAFADGMDEGFFKFHLGIGGSLTVDRLHLPGISTSSTSAYFMVCSVLFAVTAVGVLAVRRGRFGRQLTALNDSPAACATLGVNTNITKVVIFSISAGLAGLAGALFGGVVGLVGPNDFAVLFSLSLLLSLRVFGINTITGALFGALSVNIFPSLNTLVPVRVQLPFLLTGIAAVSIGRDPDGLGGQLSKLGAYLRGLRRSTAAVNAPALEKEGHLVHS